MIFTEEHTYLIRTGQKTQTRRAVSDKENSPWFKRGCRYSKGDTIAVQPGRNKPEEFRIRLTEEPRLERLGDITNADARAEGARSRPTYQLTWKLINGRDSWKPKTKVWDLTFEAVLDA